MFAPAILVLTSLVAVSVCEEDTLIFPNTLKFGVATSSYQIEGAWNVSDKGINNWDTYVHTHGVSDGNTGDVACDSYHHWSDDVENVAKIGLDFYRFSLSWSRILPSGFNNHISEDGKRYYNNLIDKLIERGLEPYVTIYHWDLPQPLQDLGGWANPLISDWFEDYARVVFKLFGDRVKTWITINEPISVCDGSSTLGIIAPGNLSPDNVGTYLCTKNVLVAHAKAWRLYDREFRPKFNGQISYCNNLFWYEEKTSEDAELAELARQHNAGRYSHAVFSKEGGWPPALEKFIAEKSAKQGYRTSRLPAFTSAEIELVRGTYDFYGMNLYTSRVVSATDQVKRDWFPFADSDELNAALTVDPSWTVACNDWIAVHPEGIRRMLVWLKQQYGDIKFLITENGYPTCKGDDLDLDDQERVDYYRGYLKEVKKAMTLDGVNIAAFTAWSLMDNFEWMDGYRSKFGLYAVNFSDPHRARSPRKSAYFFAEIIQSRVKVKPQKIHENKTASYMWYSFVVVVVLLVVICSVLVYKIVKRRRTIEEKTVENITPLMTVQSAKE
ncbi:myrosinase 1-like [Plodia interpunctella]|uniref:myrosinase 1-like n=1 Tax=Plodia interpunctella TaxID=58824 RepID=UPI002368B73A|nr:myrosinase 1-like [Plodia interpunctella]